MKIKELLYNQGEILTLKTKDTVETALEKLAARNITSAPVLDDNQKIWGFLDVFDLMLHLVNIATRVQSSKVSSPSIHLTTDDIGMIAKRSGDFALTTILDVITRPKQTRHDPYYPLTEDQDISDAVQIFLKGVHRIAVTDSSHKIINVLSQSDFIRFMARDTSILGMRGNKTVSEIDLLSNKVVTVDPGIKTIDAFIKMSENGVNSAAITSNDDVILGTISSSDLKGLKDFKFMRLLLPVSQFIAEIRQEQGKKEDYVVVCEMETTLKRVVEILAKEHVHRMFVVDIHKRLKAVLSLGDLIREGFSGLQ